MKRKAGAIIATVFAGFILLLLQVEPIAPRISIPLLSSSRSSADTTCTLVGYAEQGFPFRTNLNDSCGQDNSNTLLIIIANFLINIAVLILIYKLILPPLNQFVN